MSQPVSPIGHDDLDIRGHSRFDRGAPFSARLSAISADLCLGWLLTLGAYFVFDWEPLPDWKFAVTLALAFSVPLVAGKTLLGQSLGDRFWGILRGKTRHREASDSARGGFLTLGIFAAGVAGFAGTVGTHPYWRTIGSEISLPAIVPPSDWKVLAFFYTLAPWPTAVGGHPVFYSVPYEVGPPKRFVGDITADWIPESVRLTIEGPKTPDAYQSRELTRTELHQCFDESPLLHPSCVAIRRTTLSRPMQAMRDLGYTQFMVSWFSAENPGIPDDQRVQGVRLQGLAGARTQDRYILVTPHGMHETIALSYLNNQEGRLASRDVEVVLGALRISEDLAPGRSWTESILETVHLDQLPPMSDGSQYLTELADIQSSLVAMLSVSPSSFDAYYHLAGSSMLLLKYASQYPGSESTALRSLAQEMVGCMDRYGHDVEPSSPQIPALDQLAKEAKQF